MIDEWGNEVPENQFLTLKQLITKNRSLLLFLAGVFLFTLALLQLIPFLSQRNGQKQNQEKSASVSAQVTPRAAQKLSSIATASGFLQLVEETATLSGKIENVDLYESQLVFPPVNTKVEFNEQ